MDGDESVAKLLLQQIAALTEEVRSIRDGQQRPASRLLVSEGYTEYEKAHHGAHSWRMTKDKLAPMVRRLGHMLAVDITPRVWTKHRAARRGELIPAGKSKGQPPAESTLNVELGVAKKFLEWLVEQELIPHNPLRPARYETPMKKRKSWPRPELFARLLESPRPVGAEQRAVFHGWLTLLYETGLRFDEGRLARRDRRRQTADGWALDIDTTKGGEPHTVGLTDVAIRALDAIIPVVGSPYYFTRSMTKRPYGKRIFGWWFRNACEAIGLDAHVVAGEFRFRPHDLRRAAAKNLVERGGDILDAKEMLGHKSVRTTEGYVGSSTREALRIARIMERRGPQHADDGDRIQPAIMSPAGPVTRR